MALDVISALHDPRMFQRWCKGGPESWKAWESYMAALWGLPDAMTDERLAIYQRCTGRQTVPQARAKESYLIVGRRGGKSVALSITAVMLATWYDWRPYLVPGERGTILVIASDREQAKTIWRYIRDMLQEIPVLAELVERITTDEIELKQQIVIKIATASYRRVRGYTVIAALCDELAFWRSDESANPDREILDALRPAMASIPGSMLLCASSPYARRGVLWEAYRRHYGRENARALVWHADTRTMNPNIDPDYIAEAYENDAAAASAEYGAQFRSDIEAFVSIEAVEAVTFPGRHELPRVSSNRYVAFVDPSGGSADSMTLGIAHEENGLAVLDAIREIKPPFTPSAVVVEFSQLIKSYGISSVSGDRYAGEWPREQFRLNGVEYTLSEKPKSDMYRDLLPVLNSRKCELLDIPKISSQLVGLERRTARGGRDSIDHMPGAHDDVANCVAGALLLASKPGGYDTTMDWVGSWADIGIGNMMYRDW